MCNQLHVYIASQVHHWLFTSSKNNGSSCDCHNIFSCCTSGCLVQSWVSGQLDLNWHDLLASQAVAIVENSSIIRFFHCIEWVSCGKHQHNVDGYVCVLMMPLSQDQLLMNVIISIALLPLIIINFIVPCILDMQEEQTKIVIGVCI